MCVLSSTRVVSLDTGSGSWLIDNTIAEMCGKVEAKGGTVRTVQVQTLVLQDFPKVIITVIFSKKAEE